MNANLYKKQAMLFKISVKQLPLIFAIDIFAQ